MALLFMFRIVLSYWCLATVVGLPGFRDKIPNGYNVPSWAGVGHLMPGKYPNIYKYTNYKTMMIRLCGLLFTKRLIFVQRVEDRETNSA
jgi:hypothetical protein